MWGMGAAKIAGAIAQLVPSDRAELKRLMNQVADRMESNAAGTIQRRSPA